MVGRDVHLLALRAEHLPSTRHALGRHAIHALDSVSSGWDTVPERPAETRHLRHAHSTADFHATPRIAAHLARPWRLRMRGLGLRRLERLCL